MALQTSFDLVAIGAGPGGYVGAIRAAQLGMSVACVELGELGGTCLNWGCIPTKALLAAAEFYHQLNHEAAAWGIGADNVRYDWTAVINRSRTVAGNLNKGISALFKKNKISHIQGRAKIVGPGKVQVAQETAASVQTIGARHIVIATGARPRCLPIPGGEFDGDRVIGSRDAMTLSQQPAKLAIVGAGAIGMEFAYFYNAFGTEVVVIEMLDHLLPNEDEEVSKAIEKAWRKRKIEAHVRTKTLAIAKSDAGIELTIAPADDQTTTRTISADKVLIAVGVQGYCDGLFDDALGIEVEGGHIKVDRTTYETSLPGVYAVGDVIGPPWLAHVASQEAIVCVENIAHAGGTGAQPIDYQAVPACTYCNPQVASFGVTEQACKQKGMTLGVDYEVGKFPFQASGKAQAAGHTEGFVKIITAAKHGEILGVHMIGRHVTELLAELGLAKHLEATVDDLISTMHAHPTLSEAIREAALATQARAIHF